MAKQPRDPIGKLLTLSKQMQTLMPQLLEAARKPEFAGLAGRALEEMKAAEAKGEQHSPAVRQLLALLKKNPSLEKPVLDMARTLRGTVGADSTVPNAQSPSTQQ